MYRSVVYGLLGNLSMDADIRVHNLGDLKVYPQAHDIDCLRHRQLSVLKKNDGCVSPSWPHKHSSCE